MRTSEKKYYILYKTIANEDGEIIDVQYLKEYEKQADIVEDVKINFRDIKNMINNNIEDFKNIKTHKNYTIILEKDVI